MYLFLFKNNWVLSLSGIAGVRYLTNSGLTSSSKVIDGRGVKPVINLKQGSLKFGNGTITHAYLTD